MNKALFVVPHEDDELLIGGGMLVNLIDSREWDVYVLIVTNGDYYPFEAKTRIQESIDAMTYLGIPQNNILFLGYGDCWNGTHIYNSNYDTVKYSMGGFNETYLPFGKEYCFKKFGKHNAYTYHNYQEDLAGVIRDLLPELIVCIDFDSHRDHRCLSLTFDKTIGKILNINHNYTPIVMKKFAYENVLMGKFDYFYGKPTINMSGNKTGNPFYEWNDRICYTVPQKCKTKLIENNILYKAAKKYKSQGIFIDAPRFINNDIVYWNRNTNNLLRNAEIVVSSGNSIFLNDFVLFDVADVEANEAYDFKKSWFPEAFDDDKTISITLPDKHNIKIINIFTISEFEGKKAELDIFDELKIIKTINFSSERFKKITIFFDSLETKNIKIRLKTKYEIGISEIEMLESINQFAEYLSNDSETKKSLISYIDMVFFVLKRKIYQHLPNKYLRMRKNAGY